jgi:hypothetical protein
MSILWKIAIFIEKPPVTSSNCYETMKIASLLIKLGTNVDWAIAFVTTCSVLNFLLPCQRGDISKLPKITILRWFFHQNWFQSAVKRFSTLIYAFSYDRLWVILTSHNSQVQNFLGDEGNYRPLQTPLTDGGTSPFWQPPMYLFDMGNAEQVITF